MMVFFSVCVGSTFTKLLIFSCKCGVSLLFFFLSLLIRFDHVTPTITCSYAKLIMKRSVVYGEGVNG